jgi:transposase InsO family protein
MIPEAHHPMWGTDATAAYTTKDGYVSVFIAIDHASFDCVGIHAAKSGNRFEALEPAYQGIREHYGTLRASLARGLKLRHDHGSCYMADPFQNEIRFPGIESSPAFVRSPEGNGCAERFIRILKEQLLRIRSFDTVEELRQALLSFKDLFNSRWLLERHGYLTPAAARKHMLSRQTHAA